MYKTPQRQRNNKHVDSLTASKADHKCVCAICTCGKHSCPREPRHVDPAHFNTTHNNDYKPWKNSRPAEHPNLQPYTQSHYDPNDLKSSYKNDYTPQKLPQQYHHQPDKLIKSSQPFNADSEYKDRYVRLPLAKQPAVSHQQPYHQVPGGFNNSTTYKEEYIKHQMPKKEEGRKPEPYMAPSGHTGSSTYKDEYQKFKVDPHRPAAKVYQHHQTPMTEKESIYQTHYKPFDAKNYEKELCPVVMLPSRPSHTSPGKDHLTYLADKNSWE